MKTTPNKQHAVAKQTTKSAPRAPVKAAVQPSKMSSVDCKSLDRNIERNAVRSTLERLDEKNKLKAVLGKAKWPSNERGATDDSLYDELMDSMDLMIGRVDDMVDDAMALMDRAMQLKKSKCDLCENICAIMAHEEVQLQEDDTAKHTDETPKKSNISVDIGNPWGGPPSIWDGEGTLVCPSWASYHDFMREIEEEEKENHD